MRLVIMFILGNGRHDAGLTHQLLLFLGSHTLRFIHFSSLRGCASGVQHADPARCLMINFRPSIVCVSDYPCAIARNAGEWRAGKGSSYGAGTHCRGIRLADICMALLCLNRMGGREFAPIGGEVLSSSCSCCGVYIAT